MKYRDPVALGDDRLEPMIRKLLQLLPIAWLAVVAVGACKSDAAKNAEAQAEPAARAWLALVDGESYADSWTESSSVFQKAVPSAQWQAQVSGVRKPLGTLGSRTLRSTKYATSLPGAPDGKYVVIQYATVFENKASAIETVTPMQEADGTWRVSGYYIK